MTEALMNIEQLPPLPEPYANIYPEDQENCCHYVCYTPSVQPGDGRPNHQPVFTAEQVREAQRAAIAAYRARGEAVHQFRKPGCSDWYDGLPDQYDGHGPYEERTLYTSPTAPDASQAEQAAMYVWLRENHAWWMLNRFPAQEEYTDPRVVFDDAIRAAMTKDAALQSEAARGRQP